MQLYVAEKCYFFTRYVRGRLRDEKQLLNDTIVSWRGPSLRLAFLVL
jgi:hypothetical protein